MSLAWVPEPLPEVDDLGPVVRRLHELHQGNDLEAALATGSFLLEQLFAGRAEEVLYAGPVEGTVSFRQLAQYPGLRISASYLCRALHIAAQHQILPVASRGRLGLTHLRELLVIRDPAAKAALARRAVEEEWSAAVLRREIRKLRPVKARRRSPALTRAIGTMQEVADRVASEQERAFSGLDADGMDALLAEYDQAVAALEKVSLLLHSRARAQRVREEGVVPFR